MYKYEVVANEIVDLLKTHTRDQGGVTPERVPALSKGWLMVWFDGGEYYNSVTRPTPEHADDPEEAQMDWGVHYRTRKLTRASSATTRKALKLLTRKGIIKVYGSNEHYVELVADWKEQERLIKAGQGLRGRVDDMVRRLARHNIAADFKVYDVPVFRIHGEQDILALLDLLKRAGI
jgi:hypothetical protein